VLARGEDCAEPVARRGGPESRTSTTSHTSEAVSVLETHDCGTAPSPDCT
jgi:hypothetical protein